MPIYEYQCGGCGEVFEVLQRYDDPAPEKHEACGSDSVKRVMSPSAFIFKGDGWYITDYARKGKGGGGGESSGGASSSSSGSSSSSDSSGSKTAAA